MVTMNVDLDMTPGAAGPVLHVSQYDEGSRTYNFYLFQNGVAFTPPSGAEVTLEARRPDQFGVVVDATVDGSVATVTLSGDVTALAGTVTCQLSVTSGEDTLGSANFIILVEDSPLSRGGLMPRYYYLRELPDAYRTVVDDLIDRGLFYSCGGTGENTIVNLSDDVCRLLLTLRDTGALELREDTAILTLRSVTGGGDVFPYNAAVSRLTELEEILQKSLQRMEDGVPEFMRAVITLDQYGDTLDSFLRVTRVVYDSAGHTYTVTFAPEAASETELLLPELTANVQTGRIRATLSRIVHTWYGTQAQYDYLADQGLLESDCSYFVLEDET